MDKVEEWTGSSRTHGFSVMVYRDAAAGMFVAKIHTYSGPEWTQYIPGDLSMQKDDDPEELTHKDLSTLRELTKQRIASHCGEIKDFENRAL